MADRKNTLQGVGGDPSAVPHAQKPSMRQRAWTILGGKTLDTASADDLAKAGIGLRPARQATRLSQAEHSMELRVKLSRQRRARLIRWSAVVLVVVAVAVSVYLITQS